MDSVVILAAARTPIGNFQGALRPLSAVQLGKAAAQAVIERSGVDRSEIQEVVAGMIYKAGLGGNPARQLQIGLGLPETGYACTVDQQCGSGMRAIEILSQQIQLGKTGMGIAVGMESMTNAAYVLNGARDIRMGDVPLRDTLTLDGLHCALCDYHMGVTAENLAERYGIGRQEQDELAVLSHERALAAWAQGHFAPEVVPVEIRDRRGRVTVVERDEHPQPTTVEALSRLRPAFKREGGTVTAGNASGINDGAAALLLPGETYARETGKMPLGRILATASVGVAPAYMGIGPVYAIPKALDYAGLRMEDIGYFEINEAFAAQFLACNQLLDLPMDKVNGNGSGVGLGHPVGATGARIVVSLLYELKRRGLRYGVASLCVGGGPAMATVVENL